MRGFNIVAVLILCLTTLLGCSNNRQSFGQQAGGIAIVSSQDGGHLRTRLTLADFKRLAENVTNKMIKSTVVRGWGSERKRVALGDIEQSTYDENLRMQDVYDQLQEVILNTGLVRIVDKTQNFDYVITTMMSENRQSNGNGQKLVSYILQFKMYTLEGEIVGQWSDDLTLAKAKRPLF